MAIRVRQDVYKLGQWDPVLLWYAKAVAELKKRPIKDPTSWRYQAAIHGYTLQEDPFRKAGEAQPSVADRTKFWNQCQHFSWFFLPWHRMYLHCFEQTIQATVVKLGGPPDWSLAYWNYSDTNNASARKLPPAFTDAKLPDGSANPLRIAERDPGMLAGQPMAAAGTNLNCLKATVFAGGSAGGTPGFGGPKTLFSHVGSAFGTLEATPHGDVHMAVGGASVGGWMTSFNQAALDPIFWLHHANIDRLWQVWLNRNAGFINPTGKDWLDAVGVTFNLHNGSGSAVKFTPQQVVDTTKPPLNYRYEDVTDPFAGVGLAASTAVTAPLQPAEMVGAQTGVALGNAPVTAAVALSEPQGPAKAALAAGEQPRVLLNLENVTGQGNFSSFAVYLNVPLAAAKVDDDPSLLAGTMPMFGVREASQPGATHAGDGVTYVLDITDVVNQLKQSGNWDPTNLRVTFAPISPGDTGASVRVGRVGLFYQ